MEQLLFSLNATIPVFLVMVIGYILKEIHMMDESFVKTLNAFNYKVTLPVLLFRDIAESDFYSVWDTRYVLYCFLVTLTTIVLIWVTAGLVYRDKAHLGEFIQASYRSSAAVLGIAFIQNIYGTSGMAPLMIIGTVPLYNVAAVLVLSFTGPNATGFNKDALKKSILNILKNPIILGIALGMAVSACHITFPVIIQKTVGSISSLATPLALLGLGAGFEGRKALKQIKPTIAATVLKLVMLPAIFLPLAVHMGFTAEKLVAILIMLGSPTTVSCYIMAKNMGHEGTLTSSVVVATTFLSSVTLTAYLFLLRSRGYI
ncbi:MAG: AEC family transporter [Bacteroidales bacterium]|nr:AEC family transporter [Lachnoclostridium sp.]MCM1384711.1 AEC family transporter [Lachnoclostridium sp.]MCM1465275.1 AEC family transporter [Bacteroidales bacterium]